MPDQLPEAVKRERIERLIDVVQRTAAARNADRVGRIEEVLVEGASRTDASLLRGRTRRNTTVNFAGERCGRRARAGADRRRRRRPPCAASRQSPPLLPDGSMRSRDLAWEGCLNVRDLGGHPTEDGGETRFGAYVRADNLERLTAAGWQALIDYGVRTVVDLRLAGERGDAPPAGAADRRLAPAASARLRASRLAGDRRARPRGGAARRDADRLRRVPGALPRPVRRGDLDDRVGGRLRRRRRSLPLHGRQGPDRSDRGAPPAGRRRRARGGGGRLRALGAQPRGDAEPLDRSRRGRVRPGAPYQDQRHPCRGDARRARHARRAVRWGRGLPAGRRASPTARSRRCATACADERRPRRSSGRPPAARARSPRRLPPGSRRRSSRPTRHSSTAGSRS